VPLWKAICSSMHCIMCAALRVSKSGKVREKSTLWHTGHSSSSLTWGIGGRGRLEEANVLVYWSFPMSKSDR
jgi:hypothetical protein